MAFHTPLRSSNEAAVKSGLSPWQWNLHALPACGQLQIPREVGRLLHLGRQHGIFEDVLFAQRVGEFPTAGATVAGFVADEAGSMGAGWKQNVQRGRFCSIGSR